jgi:hypothetical protein
MDRLSEPQLALSSAQAALASTGNSEWDAAFADWLICNALDRADYEFGSSKKADDAFEQEKLSIEGAFGREYRSTDEGEAAFQVAFASRLQAERDHTVQFSVPMWRAAVRLALVPAPNLAAALFKVELILREELDNDAGMSRGPFEVVQEDMERLRAA